MSYLGQYAKNMGVLVGQSVVRRAMGMVTTMVLARTMGVASFGTYSVVTNTATSAFGLVRFGIDAAIHVHTAEGHADEVARTRTGEILGAGFLLLLAAGLIGGLGCLVAADWLAQNAYGKPELAIWIRVAGAGAFLQCASQYWYVTMAGLHRFVTYARIMVASAAISAVATILGVVLAGLSGAVGGMISAQALTVIWLAWTARVELRAESVQLSLRGFYSRSRLLLKFGLPFYAAGLLAIPATYYLQSLVARYGGLESLGYLRALSAITALVSFAPSSASGAMISMLTKTRTEDESALAGGVMRNAKMVLLFALITAGGVTILLPWLMPVLLGQQYVAAIGAAGIALLTSVLVALNGVIGNALFSAKRVNLVFLITLIQVVVFCTLGIILIPLHGLVGYLVAELISYLTLLGVVYWGSLDWFSRYKVHMAWVARAVVPFFLLAAYSGQHLIFSQVPSVLNGLIGAGGLLLVCLWGYVTILDNAERSAMRRIMRLTK